MIRQKHKVIETNEQPALSGSTLLSLSLFIILLAFFIVLNALSYYVENKVDAAFDSLDLAFATQIVPASAIEETMAENQPSEDGAGDSLEDVQATLRAVLPGLNVQLTDDPNAGQVMAIRMQKDQFEKLSKQLIPVFVRILNLKDDAAQFHMHITSYVRDPLSDTAQKSLNIIQFYRSNLVDRQVDINRLSLAIEQGNPAFLSFSFEKGARYER